MEQPCKEPPKSQQVPPGQFPVGLSKNQRRKQNKAARKARGEDVGGGKKLSKAEKKQRRKERKERKRLTEQRQKQKKSRRSDSPRKDKQQSRQGGKKGQRAEPHQPTKTQKKKRGGQESNKRKANEADLRNNGTVPSQFLPRVHAHPPPHHSQPNQHIFFDNEPPTKRFRGNNSNHQDMAALRDYIKVRDGEQRGMSSSFRL
jgi:hypothetical protein